MALAMVIGLVAGYAWSVVLLYRQGQHDPLLGTASHVATGAASLEERRLVRADGMAMRSVVQRRA
jgi:hypothetical protein